MNQVRIQALDSIRGFAIVGILLVNIISFSWPELYDSFPSSYWQSPTEQFLHNFSTIFAQSSFYPIFATLFGISMSFVFKSALRKGLNPYIIFSKRLLFLLLIGAAHAFFIWHGDILLIYAILGFLLMPFYRLKPKAIANTELFIWLIPNFLYGMYLYGSNFSLVPYNNSIIIQEIIDVYNSEFSARFFQNFHDWQLSYVDSIPFIFISIFPMFLFGLAAAKSNLFNQFNKEKRILYVFWLISGALGLTLKTLFLIEPSYVLVIHLSEAFGGPILGLFYSLSIIMLGQRGTRIQAILADIGRTSMSNYLFQSIVGLIIFRVFGFYGKVEPIATLTLAAIIILLQALLSRWWLMYHNYGPLEFVWKKVTFLQLKPRGRGNVSA
ncbi:DUF418 domain-containing protein [Neobacillus notoginsengisoli]|uniref:DUF418 domain-containing protein n=1 Tax=Neobacillus notoginsengisoli TaxID=1578198 RepID=A0A417YQE7_9BACI|nr:DUF418 domain-containing protein [Neobacillus notoginsengisoli]RHW35946.1 DUF418 domain-containing protein [Neobacillus notoginsengisoli]